MTEAQEQELLRGMNVLLDGGTPDLPACQEVYAWRVIRWEADVPLAEGQAEVLLGMLGDSMRQCGLSAGRFSEDGDALTILLCLTRFPARAHRETVLWLCAHALLESCSDLLEQEGTMLIGEEFEDPTQWRAHTASMKEVSEWWSGVSAIDSVTARQHRTKLQTLIKRRQYTVLGGYVSRALRTEQEVNRVCFSFVPLMIEAIWSQHAEISLRRLTEELNLNEMTRKPREALLAWTASLQPRLQACPTATSAAPIERVIAGIRADCSLPYSQANLSRSLGLTPAYFCRLFHEQTGQHFSTFLTCTRMEKAQALLREPGEKPLQEISQACGYPNKSYFCQVFKKYTGMTPGEFEQARKGTP